MNLFHYKMNPKGSAIEFSTIRKTGCRPQVEASAQSKFKDKRGVEYYKMHNGQVIRSIKKPSKKRGAK